MGTGLPPPAPGDGHLRRVHDLSVPRELQIGALPEPPVPRTALALRRVASDRIRARLHRIPPEPRLRLVLRDYGGAHRTARGPPPRHRRAPAHPGYGDLPDDLLLNGRELRGGGRGDLRNPHGSGRRAPPLVGPQPPSGHPGESDLGTTSGRPDRRVAVPRPVLHHHDRWTPVTPRGGPRGSPTGRCGELDHVLADDDAPAVSHAVLRPGGRHHLRLPELRADRYLDRSAEHRVHPHQRAALLHLPIVVHPGQPWRGCGPLDRALRHPVHGNAAPAAVPRAAGAPCPVLKTPPRPYGPTVADSASSSGTAC